MKKRKLKKLIDRSPGLKGLWGGFGVFFFCGVLLVFSCLFFFVVFGLDLWGGHLFFFLGKGFFCFFFFFWVWGVLGGGFLVGVLVVCGWGVWVFFFLGFFFVV